ncbi:septum formation family protein [Streptomyces sp. NPDC048208]|uniref:septum formation family protein n=1 Tax=Streptomyces sp. NPDC048208 TaxID=3365515 RepID=UPI0037131409
MSISPAPEPCEPEGPDPYRAPDRAGASSPAPCAPPAPYVPPAPYTPYGTLAPTNPYAIASLVTGILCCLPGVGLLLGLVALRQIRGRGQRGRAAAVVGSALSGAGLGLAVLLLTTGAPTSAWRSVKDGVREGVRVPLAKGDCFDAIGDLQGAVKGVVPVPCAGAHKAEVFATFDIEGGPYPGEAAVIDAAERCTGLPDTYAMDGWAVPHDVDVFYLAPSKGTWTFGDRTVTCVLGSVTEGGTLTGSLRADESVFDADQVAYLKAAHALDAAMDTAPEAAYAEDDLPGHKAWARRVSTALAECSRTLRAHPWPVTVAAPMADFTGRLDKARALWAEAARATDADAFYVPYDAGATLIEPRTAVAVREALRLATTPPDPGGEDVGEEPADGGAQV